MENETKYSFYLQSIFRNDDGSFDEIYKIKKSRGSFKTVVTLNDLEGEFTRKEKESLEKLSDRFYTERDLFEGFKNS